MNALRDVWGRVGSLSHHGHGNLLATVPAISNYLRDTCRMERLPPKDEIRELPDHTFRRCPRCPHYRGGRGLRPRRTRRRFWALSWLPERGRGWGESDGGTHCRSAVVRRTGGR